VFTRPSFLFFQLNQQYYTLLPIPPCTHKLKAGIAYSVVATLMLRIIFFYSFAILMDVNGAMLSAG
jgi:hypothetical protein